MKKRLVIPLMLGGLLTFAACGDEPVAPPTADDQLSLHQVGDRHLAGQFVARSDGSQEVPPEEVIGTGLARFQLLGHSKLRFALFVADVANVTQAHIHLGNRGENGPVVAFLFGFVAGGVTVDGLLSEGTLTDDDVFERDGFNGTVAELVKRIRQGGAYVNTHSVAIPAGEVRGQIERKGKFSRFYQVTLRNLTRNQPLSPGAIGTHDGKRPFLGWRRHPRSRSVLFQVGKPASEGVRLIAEDGNPGTAVDELMADRRVHESFATPRPVGCIGCLGPFPSHLTMFIEAGKSANHLSLAVMLICTNDGFTGLNSGRLPLGFRSKTVYAAGYDAGTERNDELYTSIVDPCGGIGPIAVAADGSNNRTATKDIIRHHPGIKGVGDLSPAVYDWDDPVLQIVVKRIH